MQSVVHHLLGRASRCRSEPGFRSYRLDMIHALVNNSAMTDASLFELLADPTRRRVVELLAQSPRRAGELADEAGTSPQAMSNHLRLLLDAGVVVDGRVAEDARARVFRLQPDALVGMQAWLDQLQAEWRVQLRSFKRRTEGRIT